MKLLYLTPTYNSYSEVWQQRHIEMLKDHIFCIATTSANENKWNDQIPIETLNPETQLITKIRKYLNVKSKNQQVIDKNVKRLIDKAEVVFIQYLTFAEQFHNILNECHKPVYIHTHGFDVTWNFRSHS